MVTTSAGRGSASVPPPPPSGPRTVLFKTNPAGAHIRLTASNGKVYESTGSGSASFVVPADVYAWEATLSGYLSDRSGQRNSIDLLSKVADTMTITLTLSGDRVQRMETANTAFNDDRCAQAIELYQRIERPGEMGGDVGRTWLESRSRLAQCQRKLKQYDPAVATYRLILDAEPFQWIAKFELAATYCDSREYKKGADAYREIDGPYLNRVAQDRRQAVQALVRYGRAVCLFKDYEGQLQPDNHPELKDPALRLFDEFLYSAERLLQGALPTEIKSMLTRAFNDATAKLAELKG